MVMEIAIVMVMVMVMPVMVIPVMVTVVTLWTYSATSSKGTALRSHSIPTIVLINDNAISAVRSASMNRQYPDDINAIMKLEF